jgi:hypothetical protein
VLHTNLSKECVSEKANLDNHNGFTNPRENIKNIRSILEFLKQNIDAKCKVFPTTFYGFAKVWYHNLEPD